MNRNPHKIPTDQIIWKKDTYRPNHWIDEYPLKVNLGPSDLWRTEDGRPFIRIAELSNPKKCTYICHPDNFKPISDFAKMLILGGKL